MNRFLAPLRALTSWYFLAPSAIVIGIVIGAFVLVNTFPTKHNIGVIDIPYTVITDDSAYVITQYLDYARQDDSIKAVVIRIASPGGGAASSERLYIETSNLRAEKPVVMVMNGLVASGGYMMAMGVNHTFAQTSSLVGNVGVITIAGPLIPRPLPESIVVTGPHKLYGSSRRDWIGLADELKDAFAQMVIRERGDKLRVTKAELTEGRLYAGVDAARLGIVDEIGGDSDAMEKAAELAGISSYGTVDVNAEVLRASIERTRRIFRSELDIEPTGEELLPALLIDNIERENPLPDFPLDIQKPNIYYLYAGNDY
ncbi:MAG: S49 family peptidase [Chloroflexi bacterium]|nr:S49 family peptidase [Chloroflexota bacterium]